MSAHKQEITLHRIELELAREPAHPAGDPAERYIITAPLDESGRIDVDAWRAAKDRCHVVKESAHVPALVGQLVHGPGGRWLIDYEVDGRIETEAGFRFDIEHFVPGEYVSITREDGPHPFRVVRAAPV